MKDVLYFYLPKCPYCAQASKDIEELKKENPRYAKIDIKTVDESLNEEFAAKFDYNYVPCFYVDGVKRIEGQCDKRALAAMFDDVIG